MKLFRYDKILFEKQSGEQLVQVVQRDDRRELRFGNHITQSATSLENPDFLQLDYTRAMMAAFLFAPKPTRILHIGLGAGSVPRQYPASSRLPRGVGGGVAALAFRLFSCSVCTTQRLTQWI